MSPKLFLPGLLLLLLLGSCARVTEAPTIIDPKPFSLTLDSVRAVLTEVAGQPPATQVTTLTPLLDSAGIPDKPLLRDTLAEAYRVLGAAHYRLRDYEQARNYYQKGLDLQPAGDLPYRLHCNIGSAYYQQDDYPSAIAYFDSGRLADAVLHHEPFYISATYYTGHSYAKLGESHFAENYFRQTVELAAQESSVAQPWLSRGYTYLTEIQRRQSKLQAALQSGRTGLTVTTPRYLRDIHLHLGNVWQDSLLKLRPGTAFYSAATDSALHHTRVALDLAPKNSEFEFTTILNLGELYRRLGRYPEARAILDPPIKLLAPGLDQDQRTNKILGKLYINRGEARRDAGDRPGAYQDIRAAVDRLVAGASLSPSTQVPDLSGPLADPSAVLVALQDLAEWHRKAPGDSLKGILSAVNVYDSALVLTERLRSSYTTIEDKIALAQQTRPLVDTVLTCYRSLATNSKRVAEYARRSFQRAEQRKAITLVSNVRQDQYLRQVDQQSRTRLQQLREKQATIHASVHAAVSGSTEQQELRRAWSDQTARIRRFQDSLLRDQPTLRSILGVDRLLTTAELRRQLLAPDQAILSYHYRPGQLEVFLLTPDSLRWRTVALAPDFTADLDTLNRLLTAPHSHPSLAQRQAVYCAAAYRVYRQLFPDFDVPLPERLIIVPDAPFLTLPFEALWTSPTPGGLVGDAPTEPFLLQQHVISYAYSANLLAAMSRDAGAEAEPGILAGFAARFPRELRPGRQPLLQPVAAALPYLTPLPGEEEIERIAEHTRTHRYVGPEADRARFERADEQHRAVHVITHGIINEATPLFNFISFSQLADTLDTDQLLFLQDLYARGLDLELASFSACQTAQGKQVVGEGPMSLARGLAAAGVRSVVTQLWRVSIDDTKDWMPLFYQEFTRPGGADRDRALASAKRSFIKKSTNHRDPSSWASGVLIGYSGPLALQPAKSSQRIWWALPVSLAVLSVFFYRRRKRED